MNSRKTILYLQHADAIGGSVISLKEVIIDALARGYDCTVISRNKAVAEVYEGIGAQSLVGLVAQLNHNSAYSYRLTPIDLLRLMRAFVNTIVSFFSLRRIVKKVKPDIVHLNSSTLFLYTLYFKLSGINTILHVREYIVNGYVGLRKSIIRAFANKATYILYISEYEYALLKTKPEKSFVIYNYVHEKTFVAPDDKAEGVSGNPKFSIITLGGLFKLKGGKIILQSLSQMDDTVELIVLGCENPYVHPEEISKREDEKYANDILNLLKEEGVRSKIRFEGKVQDPAPYIRRADALIFWAASPHFPRPVFEAWLLRKPVLYFNPSFQNKIINSENVVVVEEGTVAALCQALTRLRRNEELLKKNVEKAFLLARESFTERNFERIDKVYQMCLRNE